MNDMYYDHEDGCEAEENARKSVEEDNKYCSIFICVILGIMMIGCIIDKFI